MKRTLFFILLFIGISFSLKAQSYLTRNGNVNIHSHTSLEDIDAENNEVVSLLNPTTGQFDFRIGIKSFHFKKTAMEEHFGEPAYMDAAKYPKASYTGKITNLSAVDFTKDGTYKVSVQGKLTIKDVTKDITVEGSISIKSGVVSAISTFVIKRKDYHVMGDAFVQQKINDDITINVNCQYEKH